MPIHCDILVEKGILYETKAVKRLLGKHQEQVLHYLFLTGLMGTVYRDALISLSPDVTIRETCLRTPHGITRNSVMPMFPDGSFLHFSTLRKNQQRYEKNLRKWFLSFQPPAIHWINLNGPTLQYRSLTP